MEIMTGYWLKQKPIVLAITSGRLRQRENKLESTYVRLKNDDLVTLQHLASHPGVQIFLQGVNISTTAHKFSVNVAIHYPQEHHGMPIEEGWFILTTLPNLTIMFAV
jgi:hypothetical protein